MTKQEQVKRRVRLLNIILGVLTVIVVFGAFAFTAAESQVVAAPSAHLIQDTGVDALIAPQELVRISWGAVFAGAIVAIVIQLTLNLLAVSVGATSINPAHDPADPQSLAIGGAIYVGISTLMALFIGGWVASRFAGNPNEFDGILHGVMTWGITTLITLFLLMTALGRLISGVSNLIGQGLNLAGRTTEVVMRGAAGATQAAVTGAANIAGGVAHAAGNAARGAANAAQSGAQGAGNLVSNLSDAIRAQIDQHPEVRQAVQGVENIVNQQLDQHPEVRDALERQQLSRDTIEHEARQLLRQAGVSPTRVQNEAREAVQEVGGAAQQAAQQVAHGDFDAAWQTMQLALRHVLREGQSVVSDVDRDSAVQVLMQRGNMNEEQARQQIQRWEDQFNQAKNQTVQVRQQAEQNIQQMRMQAEQKVEEVRRQVESQLHQAQQDAERLAREAAQATTETIAKLAGAVFAAMVIGAVAAGIGGWLGTPETITTVEVQEDAETFSVPEDAPVIYLESN
jgi:hypothetical protein